MNNLLVDYAISLTHLYGLVHKDKVAEIYNMQNEEQVDVEEINDMIKNPPEEFKKNFVEKFNDYFVAESIMDNDEFEEQLRQRRGKPFYIPEQEELLKYKDELYFEETEEYRAMIDYVAKHFFNGEEYMAQMLCDDVQGVCQFGFTVQSALDVFNNRGVGFEGKEQVNEVLQLVMNLANSTRIWENNGHTPGKIFEKYEKPHLRPLPKEPFDFKGSSGSGLADDQKSSRSNVVSFPSGSKIGRNDPCSCGSGKKYKRCCLLKKDDLAVQEKATAFMNQGRFKEAEELLTEVLSTFDDVVVRNNLAAAALEQGAPERCLDVLEPCLNPDRDDMLPNPFTFALASRALAFWGKRDEAYHCLHHAEDMFANGLNVFRKDGVEEGELHAWKEYTVAIMKAAAELGDHRRVLDLYSRWEKEHVAWESIYMAAVASFNLKEYRHAATYWMAAAKEWEMTRLFERVSSLVEQEAIPHFNLNYKLRGWDEVGKVLERVNREPAYLTQAMGDTAFCLLMLAMAFDEKVEEQMAGALIEKMVCWGEAWGEALGRRLLKAHVVPVPLKMAAARGLVEKGVFQRDEPIPVLIEGKEEHVKLEKVSVAEEADQETRAVMQKARQLKEKGRLEEAIETLQEVIFKDNFFPPLAIYLSSLLYQVDRFDEAERCLRMAERVIPEDGMVQFNLALILIKQGRIKEAEEYLQRIEQNEDYDEELREKVALLQKHLEQVAIQELFSQGNAIVDRYAEMQRKKIEEKPLSPAATLARCLKNMPAEWLTGLSLSLQIKPAPRRGEREQQCCKGLLEKERLRFLLKENVEADERELLCYLLHNGGWARLSTVSRKFGSMEGDGFYWEDELPGSPLGVLWALGLAAVGKTNLEKRREKIVTVPLELRQPLAQLLDLRQKGVED